MATQQPKVRYTYEDYCELPDDGNRYEVIDGVLFMAPAPLTIHQRIVRSLFFLLWPFVRDGGLGEVFDAPCDVVLSREDVFQLDILFVSADRIHIITERACEGPPDLVVEVLSPSTRQRDLELKRFRYAFFGVLEYWLVDPERRSILVLDLVDGEYMERGNYGVGDVLDTTLIPGLVIPLARVFEGV